LASGSGAEQDREEPPNEEPGEEGGEPHVGIVPQARALRTLGIPKGGSLGLGRDSSRDIERITGDKPSADMPISPNLALGLLASLTVATWALAWIVHESQRRSAWVQEERVRIQSRLLASPSQGRRRRSRRRSGSSSRRRTRREASPVPATAEGPSAPLAQPSLEQVRAPLPASPSSPELDREPARRAS
jgi:hypothetical protein